MVFISTLQVRDFVYDSVSTGKSYAVFFAAVRDLCCKILREKFCLVEQNLRLLKKMLANIAKASAVKASSIK